VLKVSVEALSSRGNC